MTFFYSFYDENNIATHYELKSYEEVSREIFLIKLQHKLLFNF